MKKSIAIIAGPMTLAVLFATGCVSTREYDAAVSRAHSQNAELALAQQQVQQANALAQAQNAKLQAIEATLQARILDEQSVNRELQNEYFKQQIEVNRWMMLTGARLHRPR